MVENLTADSKKALSGSSARWIALGAVLGLLAVATGALGAHGMESFLQERFADDAAKAARRLDNWDTAAHYQLTHALAIVAVGLAIGFRDSKLLRAAGFAFLAGVVLFSGMLYALVLTEATVLGAIVPLGGVSMMVGWALLAWSCLVEAKKAKQ